MLNPKITDQGSKVKLEWTPDLTGQGYRLYVDGVAVSRTFKPDASSTTFSKPDAGAHRYGVQKMDVVDALEEVTFPVVQPPTGVVEVPASVSPSQLSSLIAGAPAGDITVRPVAGVQVFNVTGNFSLTRQGVIIQKGVFRDVNVGGSGSRFTFEDCTIRGIWPNGASDWTILRCLLDGQGQVPRQDIYSCRNWKVLDSTIRNYRTNVSGDHTEAFYIGGGNNGGLIQSNTFTNNGTTSHIFFTWWGGNVNDRSTYPQNICVKGNTFGPTAGAYYSINFREEITAAENIRVQPGQPSVAALTTHPQFNGNC